MKINIKALTVNQCWQGRRFKTPAYTEYEKLFDYLLHNSHWKPTIYPKMFLKLRIGLSNSNADLDNVLKPIQDVLQKHYDFNDKQIYKIDVEKIIVKKKSEFIELELEEYEEGLK